MSTPAAGPRPEWSSNATRKSCDDASTTEMLRVVDSHEHYYFSEDFSRTAERPEATLQSVIDTIPALVWCTRADGFVEFINQRWAKYTGSTPIKGDDLPWSAVVHPNDLHGLQTSWKASESAGRSHWCEVRLRRSDGVFRWFLLHLEPFRDETGSSVTMVRHGDRHRRPKQTESLRAAEKRTLEMIADGAKSSGCLGSLCSSIDVQVSPSVTTILLMDPDGERLWQGGGPSVPREWISA